MDLGINIPSTIFDFYFFNFFISLTLCLICHANFNDFWFTIVFFLLLFSFLCFVIFPPNFAKEWVAFDIQVFFLLLTNFDYFFSSFLGQLGYDRTLFLWFNWKLKNDHPCGRMGDKPWLNVEVGSWLCTFTRQWDAWKYTKKNSWNNILNIISFKFEGTKKHQAFFLTRMHMQHVWKTLLNWMLFEFRGSIFFTSTFHCFNYAIQYYHHPNGLSWGFGFTSFKKIDSNSIVGGIWLALFCRKTWLLHSCLLEHWPNSCLFDANSYL